MPDKKKLFFYALLWTVLITVLSLITIDNMGGGVQLPYKDKMVHFVFYFVFVLLWFRYKKSGHNDTKKGLFVFAIAIIYGLLMEVCQHFFTVGRTADLYDAMANSSGALVALLFIYYRFLNKRKI